MFRSTVSSQDRYPRRPAEPLGSCGVNFPAWKAHKSGFFSDNCQFQVEMEPFHSTDLVPFQDCFDGCEAQYNCTHFVYEAATTAQLAICHFIGWPAWQGQVKTVILPRKPTPTRSCGFFYRKSHPSFIQGVMDYWPYIVAVIIFMALIGKCLILL